MTASEKIMIGRLLGLASERFSNHGCNDLDEEFFKNISEEDKRQLNIKVAKWNGEDSLPEGGSWIGNNSVLMSYFSEMIEKEGLMATREERVCAFVNRMEDNRGTFREELSKVDNPTVKKLLDEGDERLEIESKENFVDWCESCGKPIYDFHSYLRDEHGTVWHDDCETPSNRISYIIGDKL